MATPTKTLLVGFDGFVDSITRPIRHTATAGRGAEYYPDIASLGLALQGQAGKSCSIELDTQAKKPGGNAPLLSSGASRLGLDVTCIGMLGQPAPDPLFANTLGAQLYSYAPPGESIALEFDDGKVFLAPGIQLERPAWQLIETATRGRAAALIASADGLAVVNWSELSFAQQLWQDVLEQALLPAEADKGRTVLFDLCDCSRRESGEIDAVLALMGRYSARRRTLLSLNENEADVLAQKALGMPAGQHRATAEALRERYGIDAVLIHTRQDNTYVTERGSFHLANDVIGKPRISTGAGDHFNAAVCYACAHGMGEDDTLTFATRFVHHYLCEGEAPSPAQMGL